MKLFFPFAQILEPKRQLSLWWMTKVPVDGKDVAATIGWTKHFITARKRSLGQGNVFTPVCHSAHRGRRGRPPIGRPPQAYPANADPPGVVQTPPHTVNKRAVRILLECILCDLIVFVPRSSTMREYCISAFMLSILVTHYNIRIDYLHNKYALRERKRKVAIYWWRKQKRFMLESLTAVRFLNRHTFRLDPLITRPPPNSFRTWS